MRRAFLLSRLSTNRQYLFALTSSFHICLYRVRSSQVWSLMQVCAFHCRWRCLSWASVCRLPLPLSFTHANRIVASDQDITSKYLSLTAGRTDARWSWTSPASTPSPQSIGQPPLLKYKLNLAVVYLILDLFKSLCSGNQTARSSAIATTSLHQAKWCWGLRHKMSSYI